MGENERVRQAVAKLQADHEAHLRGRVTPPEPPAVEVPEATPAQNTIVWGSYFARLLPERQTVEFGSIPTWDEMLTLPWEIAGPFTDPDKWAIGDDLYARGFRLSRTYDKTYPEGRWSTLINITAIVPITAHHFDTARDLRWDLAEANPTDPDHMALMRAVFTDPAWEGDRS